MIVDDQRELLSFLGSPAAYRPAAITTVDRIDTHSASVFLAGDDAYKLKRAVRYDYLDFSTAERRHRLCELEVALNRRVAPGLYLGVVAVTREPDGQLALDGSGPPIEWLVHMRRFDADGLLDHLAGQGRLDLSVMPALAGAIAELHAGAARCAGRGGAAAMRWVIDGNELGFGGEGKGILDAAQAARVTDAAREAITRHAALLDRRGADGWIRACHGDLHLRNIVLFGGKPVPFDAVEFNDDISCIDVLYDVAFLLMDLWRLTLTRHANELFNDYIWGYAWATAQKHDGPAFTREDCGAFALLPLFLSSRSAVRAKTNATASRLQSTVAGAASLASAARAYLADAERMLQPRAPVLVAIGGLSGSGKSTVARAIADAIGAVPGAVVVRSDVLRKRLAGVAPTERLAADAYTAEMNDRVYEELGVWARSTLSAGHSVVVDAVCPTETERHALERLARVAGVAFAGIWLEAPRELLAARVTARRNDASDATAAVVADQVGRAAGRNDWMKVAADADVSTVEQRVRTALTRVL